MLLADMGAGVLRVEAPDRYDMVRARPPFDDGVSAGHAFLNRSKRSIALNLKTPQAIDVVKRLVQTYDIILEQFRPGVMARLGLDYDTLAAINPRLIYCSLTGYGQTGPLRDRAGHDNNYLALAGVMSHSGTREAGPVPQGVQVADIGAGSMNTVAGILAAVVHRNETGEGQHVDVSMFDGAVLWNGYAAASYLVSGEAPTYQSMPLNGGSHYGYYTTADGRYLSVGSLEPQFWRQFCQTLERPDLIERLTLPGPEMDAVIEEIRTVIAQKTLDEWQAIFAKADCCVEPVLTLEEAFAHPHTIARSLIAEVPKPNGGTQRQAAMPVKFSKSKPTYKHIGAERGEHTEDVLHEAGYTTQDIDTLRAKGAIV
jgi:crotonobetainyl-CoA:carnitine CoA-transferase CaiB-like acyl-CoA transferase